MAIPCPALTARRIAGVDPNLNITITVNDGSNQVPCGIPDCHATRRPTPNCYWDGASNYTLVIHRSLNRKIANPVQRKWGKGYGLFPIFLSRKNEAATGGIEMGLQHRLSAKGMVLP